MKRLNRYSKICSLFLAFSSVLFILSCQSGYYTETDYFKVPKIDAHVHISTTDASIQKYSLQENIKLITINVNSSRDVNQQHDTAIALIQ